MKHPGDSPRHVAVTAEVKIELEGIGQHDAERVRRAEGRHIVVSPGYGPAEKFRQNYFFEETHGKHHQSLCHVFRIRPAALFFLQKRDEFPVEQNRPHGYLGKIHGKEQVVQKAVLSCFLPVGIHQPGNLLKGKETDPRGKEHL